MGRVRVSGKVFGDELYCPHLSSKREGGDTKGGNVGTLGPTETHSAEDRREGTHGRREKFRN